MICNRVPGVALGSRNENGILELDDWQYMLQHLGSKWSNDSPSMP